MTTRSILRLLSASTAALVAVAVATPAHADVGLGWSDPAPVSLIEALLLLGLLPIGIAVVVSLVILAPGLARGEGVTDVAGTENRWLGGSDRDVNELPAAGADADTGGAGGRW